MKNTEDKNISGHINCEELFDKMLNGFAYHEIICDEKGQAIDYRFLKMNKAFAEMTGIKDSLIGKTIKELNPKIIKEKEKWIEKYGRVALLGQEERFEAYTDWLDKWFSIYAYSPKKGYFAVMIVDISETKKKERDMVNLAREWSETFDSMSDGISIHDADFNILNANDSICKLLGLEKKDLVGKKCYSVFHSTSKSVDFCPLLKSRVSQKREFIEYFDEKRNLWFSVAVTPIFEKGGVCKYIHVVRNIKDRKEAKKKL